MKKFSGFTLAEVLITLAIIGVVAAMTIPSVIVNTNQQEFKTGLKKAVSVLNQAVTMNIALDSESPADMDTPQKLFNYFTRRLNVIKTTKPANERSTNMAFYTSDGMRYEVPEAPAMTGGGITLSADNSLCGTPGRSTTNAQGQAVNAPCMIIVDVNGDKKPNPPETGAYVFPKTNSTRIYDVFNLMVTDNSVIPLGIVAQRTMFQND